MRSPIFRIILAIFALVALASAHPTGDTANTESLSDDNKTNGSVNATLAARWDVKGHDLECQPAGWDNGKKKDLERAIKYIRNGRQGSSPRVPKLPGERGQTAACVGNTKVKWLNDNKGKFTLPSWNNVADGAQIIHDLCEDKGVSGELNHGDHWRVQVYWEDCYMQPGSDY